MTKEQFFDWLSGYFDICEPDRIGVVETQIIKDHIGLVRGVEALPPRMSEEDVEKLFADLPPPPIREDEYDCFGDEEFVKSIPKRMKPLQSKQVINPTNWVGPQISTIAPSANITVC